MFGSLATLYSRDGATSGIGSDSEGPRVSAAALAAANLGFTGTTEAGDLVPLPAASLAPGQLSRRAHRRALNAAALSEAEMSAAEDEATRTGVRFARPTTVRSHYPAPGHVSAAEDDSDADDTVAADRRAWTGQFSTAPVDFFQRPNALAKAMAQREKDREERKAAAAASRGVGDAGARLDRLRERALRREAEREKKRVGPIAGAAPGAGAVSDAPVDDDDDDYTDARASDAEGALKPPRPANAATGGASSTTEDDGWVIPSAAAGATGRAAVFDERLSLSQVWALLPVATARVLSRAAHTRFSVEAERLLRAVRAGVNVVFDGAGAGAGAGVGGNPEATAAEIDDDALRAGRAAFEDELVAAASAGAGVGVLTLPVPTMFTVIASSSNPTSTTATLRCQDLYGSSLLSALGALHGLTVALRADPLHGRVSVVSTSAATAASGLLMHPHSLEAWREAEAAAEAAKKSADAAAAATASKTVNARARALAADTHAADVAGPLSYGAGATTTAKKKRQGRRDGTNVADGTAEGRARAAALRTGRIEAQNMQQQQQQRVVSGYW